MRIAFDAKRAFRNNTGLGQYSRNLLSAFFEYFPQHDYHLMTPKQGDLFKPPAIANVHTHMPGGLYKTFPSLWRSGGVRYDLKRLGVDLYHGLSHEMPVGLSRTGIGSVVTMHDLIFERYPHQYKPMDVMIYRRKFMYASKNADMLIAISQQTKEDLQEYYKVPEDKIRVCYQSCNVAYQHMVSLEIIEKVRSRYQLPSAFLLSVGSVIERKNLLKVCEALAILKEQKTAPPLVVIGKGGAYMNEVKKYISKHRLDVHFISEHNDGVASADMPAIYQAASAMIYPSVYEGFGIPILEALWSKVPVITSNVSCMPETGGDAAKYVNPLDVAEMAAAITDVLTNESLRQDMIKKGLTHAQNFAPEKCADNVMSVYEEVIR